MKKLARRERAIEVRAILKPSTVAPSLRWTRCVNPTRLDDVCVFGNLRQVRNARCTAVESCCCDSVHVRLVMK